MSDKAFVTSLVLKWARETARMTEEMAAAKAKVTAEKLAAWETGQEQPTIRQAQLLAKAYKRPFALFFLPDIPRDFQPLQDFRKSGAEPLSTASVFMIREIRQKQAWISELQADNGADKLPFVGRFSTKDKPADVANDILQTLGIDPAHYRTENPMREWIDAAESNGIFVAKASYIHARLKLSADELKGFALADPFAPFVFINSDDWNAPRLFTLVHELAHIWIAQTGISGEMDPELKDSGKYHPTELFCNEVAANALMPEKLLLALPKETFHDAKRVFRAAKNLGVSSFALLVRARKLQWIASDSYLALKAAVEREYAALLSREAERKAKLKQSEKTGGPNYFLLQLNRNSRLFTQTVLDAFHGGYIEPGLASNLLNVQVNKFPKLEAQLLG